jgi:hypothetical protein
MWGREFMLGRIPARWAAALAVLVVVAAVAPVARAQQTVQVQMMVSLTSDEPGPIDPKARRIAERLKRDFRFESLRVLDARQEPVAVDGVMSVGLPNGKQARVRLLSVDERGVLLAVDIEGAVRVDARAHSGHLLVFGAGSHDGGRLVVSIEPTF